MPVTKYQSIILSDDSGFSVIQRGSGTVQKSDDNGQTFAPLGGAALPSTAILADATTNTAPDGRVERHTTSGAAAAGFGLTDAVELQSAAGNVRRVMTDGTSLVVATDGAEEARRDITLFVAGAAQKAASFGWLSGANPALYLGDPAGGIGVLRVSSFLQLLAGGAAQISIGSGSITMFAPVTVSGKVLSSDSLKQGSALTNADLSVSVVGGTEFTLPAGTLSASHILTLAITGSPITGQIIRVTRLDVTANTYAIKDDAATTLLTFPVSLKGTADFKFNGTHFVLDRYAVLN